MTPKNPQNSESRPSGQPLPIAFSSMEDFDRARAAVLGFEQREDGDEQSSNKLGGRIYQVILDGELAATTDPNTPTTADARIQAGHEGDEEIADETDFAVTVYNRHNATFASGAYALVVEVEHDDRLYIVGGGGGEGDSDCACCGCDCATPNMVHPAGFLTVRDWYVVIAADLPWSTTTDGTGEVRLTAQQIEVSWSDADSAWTADITSLVETRFSETDAGTASGVSGTVTKTWVDGGDYSVVIEIDATVASS